jgi:hypothetical protein
MIESTILVEKKLFVRRKNMAKYHQNDFNKDEFEDYDDEHNEKKNKKKAKKVNFNIVRKGVYCQNCFNEGHFTQKCKLLVNFFWICKKKDHNTDQCPSKVMSGSCPSRKNIPIHVI